MTTTNTNTNTNPALNATKHGCTADTLIIKGESQADYDRHEATWVSGAIRQDELEVRMAKRVAEAEWLLLRANKALQQVESEIFNTVPNPLEWTEEHHRALARFARYQTARENAFRRATRELREHRRQRELKHQRSLQYKLSTERLKNAETKNAPPLPLDELLIGMRKQAEELGYVPEGAPPLDVEALRKKYRNG